MVLKNSRIVITIAAVAFAFAACDKDNDRCKCVDKKNGEESIVNVDDQECSDISTPTLTCQPAD